MATLKSEFFFIDGFSHLENVLNILIDFIYNKAFSNIKRNIFEYYLYKIIYMIV